MDFEDLKSKILYAIKRENTMSIYFKQNEGEVEIQECLWQWLDKEGFIKIDYRTWLNPLFIKSVTHKPRCVILTNNMYLKISRRYWHYFKDMSDKGEAT